MERLSIVADSLALCTNPILKDLGYRKILFSKHKYFMIYRIVDNVAVVEGIFHLSQDADNLFINQLDI